jgi:hypothetical protein
MRDSTTWTIVGAIWGGGLGLIFGAIPAGSIAYILLDNLWSGSPDEGRTIFGLFWGAVVLLSMVLGASSGFLLGRSKQWRE